MYLATHIRVGLNTCLIFAKYEQHLWTSGSGTHLYCFSDDIMFVWCFYVLFCNFVPSNGEFKWRLNEIFWHHYGIFGSHPISCANVEQRTWTVFFSNGTCSKFLIPFCFITWKEVGQMSSGIHFLGRGGRGSTRHSHFPRRKQANIITKIY